MKVRYLIVVIILLALLSWLAFYWGKQQGSVKITNIATNEMLIKDIAELAALEVQGNAQISESNIKNDGGFFESIKKALVENSINITIPYIAKYGIDADSNSMKIVITKDNSIIIQLPEAKLLSYEMRLDKTTQSSSQGWFKSADYTNYTAVQQKLYLQSKKEAETSLKNKSLAQEKIVNILQAYYKPLGYKVQVKFGNNNSVELFPSIESTVISN